MPFSRNYRSSTSSSGSGRLVKLLRGKNGGKNELGLFSRYGPFSRSVSPLKHSPAAAFPPRDLRVLRVLRGPLRHPPRSSRSPGLQQRTRPPSRPCFRLAYLHLHCAENGAENEPGSFFSALLREVVACPPCPGGRHAGGDAGGPGWAPAGWTGPVNSSNSNERLGPARAG